MICLVREHVLVPVVVGLMVLSGWLVPVASAAASERADSHAGRGAAQQAQPQQAAEPQVADGEAQVPDGEAQEALVLAELIDGAMRQETGPSDIAVQWENDFLKGQEGTTYVPYTLVLDPETVGSGSIVVRIRLVERGATLPTPDAEAEAAAEPPVYPFEDIHFVELRPAMGSPHRISRALQAVAGQYDVYVAIKDSELVESESEQIKRAIFKQTIRIPDLWGENLATSSVFVTERVEPVATPLTPEQLRVDPYAIGTARLVPRTNLDFAKGDICSVAFFIYNPEVDEGKPNVTIEYSFHRLVDNGEEFFNATSPQTLSDETLPLQFDMRAGHQLFTGQNVPLSSFNEGAYRLEIKITDNESGSSVTRDVNFTVGS